MTHDRDIERILDRWFADGPQQVPDRVIDAVAERIGRQRRQPAWRLDRRSHPVNTYAKFAVATAAVFILAVGGLLLLRPAATSVGGPGPTPSVSPTASPSPSPSPIATPFACEDTFRTCAGPLTSGAHHASYFDPKIYFSTPNGWLNSFDATSIYKLDPVDGVSPSILVWSQPSIAQQTASCDPLQKAGARWTAADWWTFISSHPGLDASVRVPVDLDGSKGWSADVRVKSGWTTTCPSHSDKPYVMLLVPALGGEYGIAALDVVHLTVVDNVSPSCTQIPKCGKTVVIEVYGPENADAAVQAIIDSFSFGCGVAFKRGPCSLRDY